MHVVVPRQVRRANPASQEAHFSFHVLPKANTRQKSETPSQPHKRGAGNAARAKLTSDSLNIASFTQSERETRIFCHLAKPLCIRKMSPAICIKIYLERKAVCPIHTIACITLQQRRRQLITIPSCASLFVCPAGSTIPDNLSWETNFDRV